MRRCLLLILVSLLPVSGAPVFEFNEDLWLPIPNAKVLEKSGEETVTLIADASTPMSEFRSLLQGMAQFSAAGKVKLQLRKQHRNVVVQRVQGMAVSNVIEDVSEMVAVTAGPRGAVLLRMGGEGAAGAKAARLDQNLEGVQSFLNVAGECYAVPEGVGREVIPVTALVARSNCSFGQFLTVVQLLKQAGAGKMGMIVDDTVPDPVQDVLVDMDKKVKVPIARHPGRPDGRAKIVLTIDDDAVPMDQQGEKLIDDAAVSAYLKERKAEVEKLGLQPRVHLRTVENLPFSHVRKMIRQAAEQGIMEVIFVSLVREQQKRPERELNLALPAAEPEDVQPDIAPFFIMIDEEETVFVGQKADAEKLDEKGSLKMLDQRLDTYAAAARLADSEPLVQIHVEGRANQARVIEVINALAKYKIDRVTFVELLDE